jgi:hypothetical protein
MYIIRYLENIREAGEALTSKNKSQWRDWVAYSPTWRYYNPRFVSIAAAEADPGTHFNIFDENKVSNFSLSGTVI